MRKFIPYREIGEKDVLIIDGQHKSCVKLSHWGGANTMIEVADDSSAGIVLNAIEKSHEALDRELVSASHFDIDGFVGVWSVFYPEKAVQIGHILKHMAFTGDFREFDPDFKDAETTLKLVCWINHLEKEKFYPPFGVHNELSSCTKKFDFFLEHFNDVLDNVDGYDEIWKKEYDKVSNDIEIMNSGDTMIEHFPEISLTVVETREPLHYYAITGKTVGNDMVLSIFDNNRYELEYKYTTWIDMVSRPTWPRLKLTQLIESLNAIEKSGYKWYMDRLADSGPILRLIDSPVPKVIRYGQPYNREIFSSSIDKDILKKIIVNFFKEKYKNIIPKPVWTARELRDINSKL